MNREIKFRAWDKTTSTMINDYCTQSNNGELNKVTFHSREDAPELTLMQFSNLKDNNKKDIYEGDIIQTDLAMKGGFKKGVIKWINIDGCLAVDTGNREIFTIGKTVKYYKGKVIGNIYENPELLK